MRGRLIYLWLIAIVLTPFTSYPYTKGDGRSLLTGWYEWDPYQYIVEGEDGILKLSGLDIELLKAISSEARADVVYEPIDWDQHRRELKEGKRDIAVGMTKSPDLDPFVYYSDPYRYESTSFFFPRNARRKLKFSSVKDFIKEVKEKDFRLGVVKGFVFADPDLNAFVRDPENKRHVIFAANEKENMKRLLTEEIDGFLAERLSGATTIWRGGHTNKMGERSLGDKVPIHIAFSRSTLTPDFVNSFNQSLETLKKNGKYDDLFAQYLHPLLLLQTLDSDWFFTMELIGTIAFAISGLILAYRDRATLFGALVYAMLPSTGGGLLRDIIVGRDPVGLMLSPVYLFTVMGTVFIGYLILRWYGTTRASQQKKFQRLFSHLLVICDAMGLSTFIVIGVMVAMLMKISPLWVWGPFLAFLTGAGGGILRDIVRKGTTIASLHGDIYPEVAILWGEILSIFLIYDAYRIDANTIFYAVLVTVIGSFITRLCVYYYKLPNIKFGVSSFRGLSKKETES